MPRPLISFVGLGYVGLSTAVCLAESGFRVIGVDIDREKLRSIAHGRVPFEEEGLEEILGRALGAGRLTIHHRLEDAAKADIIFLTVGTPSDASGAIDLSYIRSAAKRLGRALRTAEGYRLVVVKSTVVPGTTAGDIAGIIQNESRKTLGADVGVAMNPEFLREGSAVADTMNPDALVIGGLDRKSSATLLRMYRRFYKSMPRTILTTLSSAEVIKYAVNTLRAVQLSTVNSFADVCSRVQGADMAMVSEGLAVVARSDPRYLNAGLGFGGSCLPKDTRALAAFMESKTLPSQMLRAALAVNAGQPRVMMDLTRTILSSFKNKRVAVLGLSFKPGTDDVRESVSLTLVKELLGEGARVSVYDPVAKENAMVVLGDSVTYSESAEACISGADCCFLATAWKEFDVIKPSRFRKLMKGRVVVDGRRRYDPVAFERAGMKLVKLGTWNG